MNDLTKLTQRLIVANDLDEISTQMQNLVSRIGMVCFLFAVDDNYLTYLSSADPNEAGSDLALKGLKLPIPKDLMHQKDIGPLFFKDLQAPSSYFDILHFLNRRGCKAAALYALIGNEKPYQIIIVGSSDPEAITANNLAPLTELCEHTSKTIDRIFLIRNLERQKSKQDFLDSFSLLIAKEAKLYEFCQNAHKLFQKYFNSDIGISVAIVSETENRISFPYYYEKNQAVNRPAMPMGEDITSYIIKNQKAVTWNSQAAQILQRLGIADHSNRAFSFIGVPLLIENKVIGVLSIQDFENEEKFDQMDITFINMIAPIFASVLMNFSENLSAVSSNYLTQKRFIDSIFKYAPFQICIKDQNGKYLSANSAALKQLGAETLDSILGKSDLNLLSELEGVRSYKDDLEIIETGNQKLGITSEINLPDGSFVSYTQNKIPVFDDTGKVIGLMGIAWEDTQLRQVQKLSQQRYDRLQAIAEVLNSISNTIELDQMLSQAVNLIERKFGLYHTAVYLIDPLHEFAVYREGSGQIAAKHKEVKHQVSLRDTSFGSVYSLGQKRLFEHAKTDREYIPDPYLPDTRSALYLPLRIGSDILGILDLESKHISGFSEEDIILLQMISEQMAVAISNATQSTKLQDYLLRQRSLYLITSNATTAQDIPQALRIMVEGLVSALPKTQVMIFTPDQENIFSVASANGYENIDLEKINIKSGEGIIGATIETHKTILITDATADPRFIPIDKDTRSAITIPIIYRSDLLGILYIESKDIRAFDENDVEILATLGNTLGSIIASVRLVGQIRTQIERQAQLYQITDKIRRAIDLDSIIQTSTIEICNALNAHRAKIQIQPKAISESALPEDSDAGEQL